jgi:fibronectin type 3 domain-containing protein
MKGLALVLIAALMVAACGKATPPVAPQVRIPAPVSDLRGTVENGAVTLVWSNPQRRADQTRLRDLVEARVYRTEDDGRVPPKAALLARGKIAGYQEIAVIRLAEPAPAVVRGYTVQFIDREGLRFGRRYTYVVVADDSRGRTSPPSERVSVVFVAPPDAPAPPRVEAGDREVRLQWQPPARLLDGSVPGPLAYEVTRSANADGPPEASFPVPGGQTQFVDRTVENDRTYHYAVLAIRTDAGTTARGEPSTRVAATPARTTPPEAPTNLVATPSRNTVRLSWTASRDPNVAGYVVYRAGPSGAFERIAAPRVPATTFTDRDLRPGVYRYVITAQDATVRANESAHSNEVRVTVR